MFCHEGLQDVDVYAAANVEECTITNWLLQPITHDLLIDVEVQVQVQCL